MAICSFAGRAAVESPFSFVDWFPDAEFNVAEEFLNLNPEPVQPDRERTSTATVCVNLLAMLFPVVVLQTLDQMEEIGEHAAHRRESSIFALCSPFGYSVPSMADSVNFARGCESARQYSKRFDP